MLLTLPNKVSSLRELPASEWGRLAGTELGSVIGKLSPEHTRIAVVEVDGQIVGCWSLTALLHAEGIWIHPEHRDGSVLRKLLRWMTQTARDIGVGTVLTGALSPTVVDLVKRYGGQEMPQTFTLPLRQRGV